MSIVETLGNPIERVNKVLIANNRHGTKQIDGDKNVNDDAAVSLLVECEKIPGKLVYGSISALDRTIRMVGWLIQQLGRRRPLIGVYHATA